MFYAGSYDSSILTTLYNFKECKTCYKYTEYESGSLFRENIGHRLKKSDNPLIIEANNIDEAYEKLDILHEQKFHEGLEKFRIALERGFEERGNDIIALSPLNIASVITKEGKIVEIFGTYISRPSRYSSSQASVEKIKVASQVMKKFNKDFPLVVNVKGSQYFMQLPPKETIRLVSRNRVNLWPNVQVAICDTREDWYCRENKIDYKNFLKLNITYRLLLKDFLLNSKAERELPVCVFSIYDSAHNRVGNTIFESFNENSEGAIYTQQRGTDAFSKEIFESGRNNADIHLVMPSMEIHCTREILFTYITVSKNKLLKCNIKTIQARFDSLNNDFNKYMLNEIRNQLGTTDWRSFLLLNEMEEF